MTLGRDGPASVPTVRSRTPLFRAPYVMLGQANYDVSADGTRFVLVTGNTPTNRLVVALNALGGGRSPGR